MKNRSVLFFVLGAVGMAQPQSPTLPLSPVPSINSFQINVPSRQSNVFIYSSGGVVKGKPFSATEENHSLQVLGNGAKIENNSISKLYRDAEGRTRTEDAQGNITIVDPVAGFRATLNSKTKVANKSNSAGGAAFANVQLRTEVTRVGQTGSELKEKLGLQPVNGVSARGERLTITIPKGDIGNDRDLKVVTERWTSEDLQMLVKSSNSDPRYGDTTYELKGISLAVPNLALFQIPADYTVTEGGAGRRVVRVAPVPAVPAVPGSRSGGRAGKQ